MAEKNRRRKGKERGYCGCPEEGKENKIRRMVREK